MNDANTINVSSRDAARWLATGEAVLIDVREPDEFMAEHIAAATSIPLSKVGEQLARLPVPAGRKIIFQCLKGGRGRQACEIATASGAGNEIYNLEGGIIGWKSAGLPVVSTSRTNVPSIFRQVQIIVGLAVALGVLAGFAGHPAGFAIAGLFGTALALAGISGWCGLALLLGRMPWNRLA